MRRRKFFELADIAASARRGKQAPPISPLAREAVTRIDAVFDAERAINGLDAGARLAVRQAEVAPLVAELETWMRRERGRPLAPCPGRQGDGLHAEALGRLHRLPRRRPRLPHQQRRRARPARHRPRQKGLALRRLRPRRREGRLHVRPDHHRASLNDVDPQAWLADVLARIAGIPASRLDDLLPWNWRPAAGTLAA